MSELTELFEIYIGASIAFVGSMAILCSAIGHGCKRIERAIRDKKEEK